MRIEQVSEHPCRLGECPLWCERTNRLWWVDVLSGALWSWDAATGQSQAHRVTATRLGSIALIEDGTLLLACADGLHHYDPATGRQRFLLDPKPDRADHRLNDGRVDPYGNFWVGCLREGDYAPIGRLYRITQAGRVRIEAQGLSIPNSLAFDAARHRIYFGDTRAHLIWVCDQADDGSIANRRVFAEVSQPARPDGSCVDSDGNLWNAVYAGGRLHQYSPDGDLLRSVDIPVTHPTCVSFGGAGLRTLFVTSAMEPLSDDGRRREPLAGHVLALDIGATGRPEHRLPTFPTADESIQDEDLNRDRLHIR